MSCPIPEICLPQHQIRPLLFDAADTRVSIYNKCLLNDIRANINCRKYVSAPSNNLHLES